VKILVTGCCGLIGSSVVEHLAPAGHRLVGIDNNLRRQFFGPAGDTSHLRPRLQGRHPNFSFHAMDIRDQKAVFDLFERERFDAVVHCAAQPSHDRAASFPLVDFSVNATGTLLLLEANRQYSGEAPFVHLSTNKVYGDAPNEIELVERDTRWDFADPCYAEGIPEDFRVDASKHSLFGASKLAADILVQEYGRYFGMPTCCLRGGCLTGPGHAGVEQHGFLSYLVKCHLTGTCYTVNGYKGKQVRDNIHASDVARFVECFLRRPRIAAVYNIGGGKENTISILEAFQMVASLTGQEMIWAYQERARDGDHICYYSALRRIRGDYPEWSVTRNLAAILAEIIEGWQGRLAVA
jgi:CDP-paratose 2-epimerase